MPMNFAAPIPAILDDEVFGEAARDFYQDARKMLEQMIAGKWVKARAVLGLFPANRIGDDDIAVYADEQRAAPLAMLHHLRQQKPHGDDSRMPAWPTSWPPATRASAITSAPSR